MKRIRTDAVEHLDRDLWNDFALALSIQPQPMTYFLRFWYNWCNFIATRYSTVISNTSPPRTPFPIISVADGTAPNTGDRGIRQLGRSVSREVTSRIKPELTPNLVDWKAIRKSSLPMDVTL